MLYVRPGVHRGYASIPWAACGVGYALFWPRVSKMLRRKGKFAMILGLSLVYLALSTRNTKPATIKHDRGSVANLLHISTGTHAGAGHQPSERKEP